jgi:hypothetical protein
MEDSQKDAPNRSPNPSNFQQETNIYEDEINLIDYLMVLWKRKWLIFFASVLPALVAGLAIFLSPRDYKISYTYNMGLGEKDLRILEETFYSTENLEKLVEKLRANGFNDYAEKITGVGTDTGLRGLVSFEISPSYFKDIDFSNAQNLGELEKLQKARGSLLVMRVGAKSRENIRGIAAVCRENFEQVIPLYSEREHLSSEIKSLMEKMAVIEEERYILSLQLEREKSTLAKLKNLGTEDLDKLPDGIVLQFNNVGNNSSFLPLPYLIQAAEVQIIDLEEQVRIDKEMYTYHTGLLNLKEKIFGFVQRVIPSYCTLEQFHSFLINTLTDYSGENQQLVDYLKAYIKRIKNKMASVVPLTEKPKIYSIAKGTFKKSAIVFVVALMISVFAAFLLEGIQKSRVRTP